MIIYKDILCKSSDGYLYENTFLYPTNGKSYEETTQEEVNFLQAKEVVRVDFTDNHNEHLQAKLKNRVEELREYQTKAEKHIRKIEDEQVREESRKAYADQVVCMMQGIGRIAMRLIHEGYGIEDEFALICANLYIGERKIDNA